MEGLTSVLSRFGPQETMDRLAAEIRAHGMEIFAQVDHAAGATAVGLQLRPTEVIIFGNAKGGTPLMQLNQIVGLDLPLKMLVWQDAAGQTWLSYHEPRLLAEAYGLGPAADPVVARMDAALHALAKTAADHP